MEVMRRMSRSKKQYWELVKPLFVFDSPNNSGPACMSQWRNYGLSRPERCTCASGYNGKYYRACIKLLEADSDGTIYKYNDPDSEPQRKPPTPTPAPTTPIPIDSSLDAECIYRQMHILLLEEDEEPPAGMLLAMIQRCRTYYDINLLFFFFQAQKLQFKRNPDAHLTEEITRACLRCGALLYAQMTMCRANSYGFTPNMASVLPFLNYAKVHDDIQLTKVIIRLMRINNWPIGPDAAEIILKIYRSETITKGWFSTMTARNFISTGVKLHQSSLEKCMEFAANKGYDDAVQDFEKTRSQVMTRHTCKSGFAYAKSFLLKREPEKAAKVILELLPQYLSVVDEDPRITHDIEYYRRKGESWPDELMIEIQKMVNEWPIKIVKIRISRITRKERIATFKYCIPKMVEYLSTKGLELKLDLDHLEKLGKSL